LRCCLFDGGPILAIIFWPTQRLGIDCVLI
jgi:hypothetical protein